MFTHRIIIIRRWCNMCTNQMNSQWGWLYYWKNSIIISCYESEQHQFTQLLAYPLAFIGEAIVNKWNILRIHFLCAYYVRSRTFSGNQLSFSILKKNESKAFFFYMNAQYLLKQRPPSEDALTITFLNTSILTPPPPLCCCHLVPCSL